MREGTSTPALLLPHTNPAVSCQVHITVYLPPRRPLRGGGVEASMGAAITTSLPGVPATPTSFSPHIWWARGQAAPNLPWCTLALPACHSAVPWHSLCGHSSEPCQLCLWGHSPTWPLEPYGPFCPIGTAPHIPGHGIFHSTLSCRQSCSLVHAAVSFPSAPLVQPHMILGTAFSTLPNAAPWAQTCVIQGRDVPFPSAPSAHDSGTAFSTLPNHAPQAQSCIIQGTVVLSTAPWAVYSIPLWTITSPGTALPRPHLTHGHSLPYVPSRGTGTSMGPSPAGPCLSAHPPQGACPPRGARAASAAGPVCRGAGWAVGQLPMA